MSRRDDQRKYMKRIAIGSGIAAVAGYVAGVLTAPKSGKETRGDIKDAANKSVIQAERELKKLHTELDKVIRDARSGSGQLSKKARNEVEDLIEKAQDSREKVREILSALHEGDASDKDLQRALKQANQALKNLKKYLKK